MRLKCAYKMLKELLILTVSILLQCSGSVYGDDVESLLGETINPILRKEWETRNNEWSVLDIIKLTPRNAEKSVKNDEIVIDDKEVERFADEVQLKDTLENKGRTRNVDFSDNGRDFRPEAPFQSALFKGTGSEHLQVKNPSEWTEEDNHWELDKTKPDSDLVPENVVDEEESKSSLDENTEEILDSEIQEYDNEQQRHNFDKSKTRKKLPKKERDKGEHVDDEAQRNRDHSNSKAKQYKQKNSKKIPTGKDSSPKKKSKTKHRFINKEKKLDHRKKDDNTMDSDNDDQREDGAAKPRQVDRKMSLINPESEGKSKFEVQDDSEWTKEDSHWDYDSEKPSRPDTHEDDGKDDDEGIFEHDEGHFDINILDINGAIDAYYNDGDGSKSNRDGATVVTDGDAERDMLDEGQQGDSADSRESISDKDKDTNEKESAISEQSENVEEQNKDEGVDNDADEDSEKNTENQEDKGDEEEEKKKPVIERKSHGKKKGGKIKVVIKGDEKVEDTLTVSELQSGVIVQEVPADKEIKLQLSSEEEINVKMPMFKSTALTSDSRSFTFHLSHGPYHNIESWYLNIVKLEKNSFGRPTFVNETKEYATHLKTHNDDPDKNDAVSIAEFLPDKVPFTFTAGTGNRYYSFTNDRLKSNTYYGVFILGVTFVNGKKVLLTNGWMEDAHSPGRATYFLTKKSYTAHLILFLLLLIVLGFGIPYVWRLWKMKKLRLPFTKSISSETSYKFNRLKQNPRKISNEDFGFGKIKSKMPKMFRKTKKSKGKKQGRHVAASSNVNQYDYEMVSFKKSGKETNQTRSNPAAVQPNANYHQPTTPGKLEVPDYDNAEYDEFGQMITPNGLSLRRHFKSETELDDTILNMYDDQTLTTETEG